MAINLDLWRHDKESFCWPLNFEMKSRTEKKKWTYILNMNKRKERNTVPTRKSVADQSESNWIFLDFFCTFFYKHLLEKGTYLASGEHPFQSLRKQSIVFLKRTHTSSSLWGGAYHMYFLVTLKFKWTNKTPNPATKEMNTFQRVYHQ